MPAKPSLIARHLAPATAAQPAGAALLVLATLLVPAALFVPATAAAQPPGDAQPPAAAGDESTAGAEPKAGDEPSGAAGRPEAPPPPPADKPAPAPPPPAPADPPLLGPAPAAPEPAAAPSAEAATGEGGTAGAEATTPGADDGGTDAGRDVSPDPTSEVYAEDWWSLSHPVFELHGYYRVRAEFFNSFTLGRRDAIKPLWPQPPDNDYFSADKRAPHRVELCGDKPDDHEPCDNATQAGANMRFRLNPELHISDNLRVRSQIDLLDNIVLGSTPQGYANQPSDGGYQVVARGGYSPTGAFVSTQWAPSGGYNSFKDSILVKRVWGEYSSPVGQLRFGRMPSHLATNAPQVSFKTGTSYGYRDAWAAGFSETHAVVVWIGRADGGALPGMTGRDTALPALFSCGNSGTHGP